jgi:hypothetical protein
MVARARGARETARISSHGSIPAHVVTRAATRDGSSRVQRGPSPFERPPIRFDGRTLRGCRKSQHTDRECAVDYGIKFCNSTGVSVGTRARAHTPPSQKRPRKRDQGPPCFRGSDQTAGVLTPRLDQIGARERRKDFV